MGGIFRLIFIVFVNAFIDELKSNRMSFVLVARPGGHKFLFKRLATVTHKIQSLK